MIICNFIELQDFLLRPLGTSSKGGHDAAWEFGLPFCAAGLSPFGGGGRRPGEEGKAVKF